MTYESHMHEAHPVRLAVEDDYVRSRLTVFFDWAIEYLTFNRGARLITGRLASDFNFDKEIASEDRRRGAA